MIRVKGGEGMSGEGRARERPGMRGRGRTGRIEGRQKVVPSVSEIHGSAPCSVLI